VVPVLQHKEIAEMEAPSVTALTLTLVILTCLLGTALTDRRCYDCQGISDPHTCTTTTTCAGDEQCFSRAYVSLDLSILYDLSCQRKDFCDILEKRKRRGGYKDVATWANVLKTNVVMSSVRPKRQFEIPLCTSCCDSDDCNVDMCANSLNNKPDGLKCFDCGDVPQDDPSDCKTVRICGVDQQCSVQETLRKQFKVGCRSSQYCKSTGSNVVFGKRDVTNSSEGHSLQKRKEFCYTCCNDDLCNADFCSHKRAPPYLGSGTSLPPATLTTVTRPPTVSTTPKPLTMVQSPKNESWEADGVSRHEMYCQAIGNPTPNYKWTFVNSNGTSVDVTSKVSQPGSTSILTLNPVKLEDEGEYTCTVDNGKEKKVLTALLTVFTVPTRVSPRMTDHTVTKGDNLTLTCDYDSYPPPSVTWDFTNTTAGVAAVDITNTSSNAGKTLVLTDIQKEDEGEYTCTVDNGYAVKEDTSEVKVQVPPEFINSNYSTEVNVTIGQPWTFSCAATGSPKPTYAFLFVDEFGDPGLLPDVTFDQSQGAISAKKVDSYWKGTFTCYARNAAGRESVTIKINPVP